MTLNIVSLNVREIRDSEKRRKIFDTYRNKCQILCLQETHSDSETIHLWANEWGGKLFCAHGNTNAWGVMCLINPKFPYKVVEVHADSDGRSVSIRLNIEDEVICLTNIYAPNRDSPTFFEEAIRQMFNISEKMIIIGDYNTVMDPDMDRKDNQEYNHKKSTQMIKRLCEELSLVEAWRVLHENEVRYSWYRVMRKNKQTKIQASRIDNALTSRGLFNQIHDSFYMNGVGSDHSAYFLGFVIQQQDRGPGYWKLNCSILTDFDYIKLINDYLACPPKIDDPVDRWEQIKIDIRRLSKSYSQKRAKESTLVISQLSERITHMEDGLDKLTPTEIELLENSKIELDQLLSERV